VPPRSFVIALKKDPSRMQETAFHQLSTSTTLLLLGGFYGLTFLLSLAIGRRNENVDGYMVSNGAIGFGIAAGSMIATWIWAASFYASATSGFTYGLSGPIHYGLWGALMILFIYPFGRRFRKLAPNAHTLAELLHARHGTSSQMILAVSNLIGSCISLMVNFTAAGALVSVLTPLTFTQGVLIAGVGVLSYTLWSGFRASVLTDFAQLVAMIAAAVIIIPLVFFNAGGVELLQTGVGKLSAEQADFFSGTAILEQGLPFFIAVLAYAIGNQTIAQRLFAVREDLIKRTFITGTIGYGSVVIGLGMLGLLALMTGLQPAGGDMNNIIPQMASSYLPPIGIAIFFILVIGSLSSTADSDLSAMSAIVMADVYGRNLARGNPKPRTMLLLGRLTMVVATVIGILLATLKLDILVMLVLVGALWGAIVFPVIASCYWGRVTNAAFTWSVLLAVATFMAVRFQLVPLDGAIGTFMEAAAIIGAGVVTGLMAFGFAGRNTGLLVGGATIAAVAPFAFGVLREYQVLLASLVAYGVSAVVCTGLSLRNRREFDFDSIAARVNSYQTASEPAGGRAGQEPELQLQGA
jgi:Na+/proline symporter